MVTIIDALPPGRIPVRTGWRYAQDRDRALQFLRSELQQGHQAYVVYPLVSESEKSDLQAATAAFEDLQQGALSNFQLGLLHGRLKRDEKETTMSAFRRGDLNALVTTTVIEVGVDVPNATVMMVETRRAFWTIAIAPIARARGSRPTSILLYFNRRPPGRAIG